jgi:hypothetical protein
MPSRASTTTVSVESNGQSDAINGRELLRVLAALKRGDFTMRMAVIDEDHRRRSWRNSRVEEHDQHDGGRRRYEQFLQFTQVRHV